MQRKVVFLATLGGSFGAMLGLVMASKKPKTAAAIGSVLGAGALVGVDMLVSKPAAPAAA